MKDYSVTKTMGFVLQWKYSTMIILRIFGSIFIAGIFAGNEASNGGIIGDIGSLIDGIINDVDELLSKEWGKFQVRIQVLLINDVFIL